MRPKLRPKIASDATSASQPGERTARPGNRRANGQ